MNKKELNDFFSEVADRVQKLTDEEIEEMEKQLKEYKPIEDKNVDKNK